MGPTTYSHDRVDHARAIERRAHKPEQESNLQQVIERDPMGRTCERQWRQPGTPTWTHYGRNVPIEKDIREDFEHVEGRIYNPISEPGTMVKKHRYQTTKQLTWAVYH